jgi:gas vesicle protein
MSKGVKFFWGFLAGAAAGAIAGVVLAPDKGSVTRVNIGKKATEYGGAAAEVATSTYKKGVEKFNTLKESAFTLVNSYGEDTAANSNSNSSQGSSLN